MYLKTNFIWVTHTPLRSSSTPDFKIVGSRVWRYSTTNVHHPHSLLPSYQKICCIGAKMFLEEKWKPHTCSSYSWFKNLLIQLPIYGLAAPQAELWNLLTTGCPPCTALRILLSRPSSTCWLAHLSLCLQGLTADLTRCAVHSVGTLPCAV